MTFKEKLEKEHPRLIDGNYVGGCKGCPKSYGYEEGNDCDGACGDEECTKCWNREMPDTPAPMTAEEAWELARKICFFMRNVKYGELSDIFGIKLSCNAEILMALSPQEAKAKIDEWESKQIQVGDVVFGAFVQGAIVLKIREETMYLLFSDGSCGEHRKADYKKTGKHIDIQSVLDQIGGDKDE